VKKEEDEMQARIKIVCYSHEKGRRLLSKGAGVEGVHTSTCDPEWRKRYCVPRKRCDRFWPDGTVWQDHALAKLLKKSRFKLTKHDRTVKAQRFEEKAFKECREIEIIARY